MSLKPNKIQSAITAVPETGEIQGPALPVRSATLPVEQSKNETIGDAVTELL